MPTKVPLRVIIVGYVHELLIVDNRLTCIVLVRLRTFHICRREFDTDAIIGIGGTAAAVALGRQGHEVVLLEAAPKVC